MSTGGAPLDLITLRGVTAHGTHGVLPHERVTGQPFSCDVTVHVDTRRAGARDDLAATLDYGRVAGVVTRVLAGPARDLIEAVADEIAREILADPLAVLVEVTVHKPRAPIDVPFEDVAVTVRRDRADRAVTTSPTPPGSPVRAVVALGSNVGDSAVHLREAVAALGRVPDVEITGVSPVVETDPVGGPGQERYLNAVLLLRTRLPALALLHACQDVETARGRIRDTRWGPRTLDVDVVAYGDLRAVTPSLVVPHPRAHERGFVLVPWLLLEPDAVLPAHPHSPDDPGPRRVADLVRGMRDADGHVPGVTVRADVELGWSAG